MIDFGPPPFVFPKPAIIRPADAELLRYGSDPLLAMPLPGMVPVIAGGGFPAVSIVANSDDAATSPFTLALPSDVQAGDLLISIFMRTGGGTQTFSWPGGWTQQFSAAIGSSARRYASATATATGSEGGSISVSSSVTSGQFIRGHMLCVKGWSSFQYSSVATGTSTAPDAPSLSPSAGMQRYLWLAAASINGGSFSVFPSGYTDGPGAGTSGVAWCHLAAASEDPGAFTISGSVDWRAYTIAVAR